VEISRIAVAWRAVWAIVFTALLCSAAAGQTVTLPNLIGLSEQEARGALSQAGVEGKVHTEVDSGTGCARNDVEEGRVCGQSPGVGKQQPAFLDVWLLLQGRRARAGGEQVQAAPKISVPSLFGASEEDAIEKIVAAGFTGAIDVQPAPQECKYAEGRVCETQPSSVHEWPADTDVLVLVQPKRTLESPWAQPPDIAGKTLQEAVEILFSKNFRQIRVAIKDDVRCKPGIVCNLIERDEFVRRKNTFTVFIGTEYPGRTEKIVNHRPPRYRQPDFRGDDLPTVVKKLDALGKHGEVVTDWNRCTHGQSEGLKPRTVCRQSPTPGQMTASSVETRVNLTMDTQEEAQVATLVMPDVVGMPLEEAKAELAAAGLTRLRVKEMSAPDCMPGNVCATSPAGGKKAYPQTVQTLFIGATEASGTAGGGVKEEPGGDVSGEGGEPATGAGSEETDAGPEEGGGAPESFF